MCIRDRDYELVEASNGLEAVTVLSQQYNEISLVLLDIVMPMMDGFEVLASMNKSGYIDHIPVIMISAETSSVYIDPVSYTHLSLTVSFKPASAGSHQA